MKTIIMLFFGMCCAILYGIGLLFGWSYKESSVYICIYLWPLVCMLTLLPGLLSLCHGVVKIGQQW